MAILSTSLVAAILTAGTCGVYLPDGAKIALQRVEDGDGITMEVVDASNYSPEVCKVIREF